MIWLEYILKWQSPLLNTKWEVQNISNDVLLRKGSILVLMGVGVASGKMELDLDPGGWGNRMWAGKRLGGEQDSREGKEAEQSEGQTSCFTSSVCWKAVCSKIGGEIGVELGGPWTWGWVLTPFGRQWKSSEEARTGGVRVEEWGY